MTRLHLDYETASEVNIKTAGAHKYAADPSTRILMLGWAIDDEPVNLWEPHKGDAPAALLDAIRDPSISKHAFNAQFERLITRYCLGIEVPPEQWRCTMVESYYLGFAGGLGKTLEAVGLEDKDKRGGQLINVFCTPAPKNHKADWYDWNNKPAEWEEFCNYCRQDVNVERKLWHWMQQFPTMHDWDYAQWCADQCINDRGVPMDTDLASSAIELWDVERERLTEELREVTGLSKVTRDLFLEWLQANTGAELDNLRKEYLAAELKHERLPDAARPAVELWAQREAKATAKYNAVINASMADDRARGMFQYKGAARTDRVGGRLIQLQNLKRPFLPQDDDAMERLALGIGWGSPGLLRAAYNRPVADILGGAIRHVIVAGEGKRLAVCDLSSIESVVLGWITDCHAIGQTFRDGRDTYKVFAAEYYGQPYDTITKPQRTFAKPPVLGCGYMLGWRGLIAYAEGYGVDMEQADAKRAVDTFRSMYPEIPAFWKWVYGAVLAVTQNGGEIAGYRMRIERDADFLRVWLPSGRALSYYKPEVRKRSAPWSEKTLTAAALEASPGATYDDWRGAGWDDAQLIGAGYMEEVQWLDNFSYMGMNDKNQWTRIFAHAGGVTENVVQSIAGDILWSGIMNAEAAGLPVILHVHDEIGCEVREDVADLALDTLAKCMTRQPTWAHDMWLGADGFTTKRYTKD